MVEKTALEIVKLMSAVILADLILNLLVTSSPGQDPNLLPRLFQIPGFSFYELLVADQIALLCFGWAVISSLLHPFSYFFGEEIPLGFKLAQSPSLVAGLGFSYSLYLMVATHYWAAMGGIFWLGSVLLYRGLYTGIPSVRTLQKAKARKVAKA